MTLIAPTSLAPLLAHPVAIFGAGVSGVGVCALLSQLGAAGVIYDAKGSPFSSKAAANHRLVIYSPGVAPEHPWLGLARTAGSVCVGELEFAAQFWRGAVIAVTGTNGKTTLTEFLTHALRSVGREAIATGNIGYSFSQLVADKEGGAPEHIAVCEVSSFQAETLQRFAADATLWTNFAEDHLERHTGLEGYFAAKWKLVEHTKAGGFIAGSSVTRYAARFGRPMPATANVTTEAQPADPRLSGTVFADYPQRENFLLAAAWWRSAGLGDAALFAAAQTFRLGRHRLTKVLDRDGVSFWNDSKATNFHAVEAALAGMNAPVVLIAGGRAKGGDLGGFVHRIGPRVKHIVLIGETSAELASHCAAGRIAHTTCASLAAAVCRAAELATSGDAVLLSPGFASFDMFQSYADRGEQFEQLVSALGASVNFR